MSEPGAGALEPLFFPDEPLRFDDEEVERLLVWLSRQGVSDIKIQTGNHIHCKMHGRVRRVTKRTIPSSEAELILSGLYGANGPSVLKDGRDIDRGMELHPSRGDRYRFRLNAVGGSVRGQRGLEITIRTISIEPPTSEALGVEEGIIRGAFPKDGIVIVAGPTGSGKSTLIASLLRRMLEDPAAHKFVTTFEAPIEYVYDTIVKPSSLIFQTEIGPAADLKNFAEGIRNAMRRAPDVIFTGESRDLESIEGTTAAAQSGHTVYTTVHANSVMDTFRRWTNFFPHSARHSAMNNMLSTVRMVVWQRLLLRADGSGGRIALREYLQFDDEIRERLMTVGADNMDRMLLEVKRLVEERGQSAAGAARSLFERGLISRHDMTEISTQNMIEARLPA